MSAVSCKPLGRTLMMQQPLAAAPLTCMSEARLQRAADIAATHAIFSVSVACTGHERTVAKVAAPALRRREQLAANSCIECGTSAGVAPQLAGALADSRFGLAFAGGSVHATHPFRATVSCRRFCVYWPPPL
jgi:hypothetical protein